ncbi:unnamed protein product, partial [Rotaria socialis]
LASKDRLTKQRRQVNENRPVNTNNVLTTNRTNASFISSLFTNTNSAYIKQNVCQQSSSSSTSSPSSTSNISFNNTPLPISDDSSAIESIRLKLAHRLAI